MVPRLSLTVLGLLLLPPGAGAQPQISNRDPKAGDVGHRPADGPTTRVNPPLSREFPNPWHLEAATTKKQARVGMLTLLLPSKGNRQVNPTAERFETDQALGAKINLGSKSWTVAFRKAPAPATWELEGSPVSGPIVVQ